NDTGVKSKYNMATSYHITNAVEITEQGTQILYPRVLVAKGTLFGFQNLTTTHSETVITLNWEDNTVFGNAKAEDTVNVVCYIEEVNTFYFFESIANRDGLTASVTLPQNFLGYNVEAYAFLYDKVSKTSSNSVYLGNIAF
ncbi:MAG: DUF6266 family protein, partial [Cloacibacterium sp.]